MYEIHCYFPLLPCYDSDIQSLGLVCTVDLFPVPNPEPTRKDSFGRKQHSSEASFVQSHGHGQVHGYGADSSSQRSYTFVPNNVIYPAHGMGSVPPLHVPPHPYLPSHSAQDVVFQMGDYQVTESSKLTQALVGATFVQPSSVEYQGRKSLLFVFAVCLFSWVLAGAQKNPFSRHFSFRTSRSKSKALSSFVTGSSIYFRTPLTRTY